MTTLPETLTKWITEQEGDDLAILLNIQTERELIRDLGTPLSAFSVDGKRVWFPIVNACRYLQDDQAIVCTSGSDPLLRSAPREGLLAEKEDALARAVKWR